jgi:hypothetical protein
VSGFAGTPLFDLDGPEAPPWTVARSWAKLSDCGQYRYALGRHVSASPRRLLICMLNPSHGDLRKDDRTVRRCTGFARSWGFGSYVVINPFAWRSHEPDDLLAVADPIGPENDQWIAEALLHTDFTAVGWGVNALKPKLRDRVAAVSNVLRATRDLHAFRITQGGAPEHPLFLPGHLQPVLYTLSTLA